MNLRSLNLQAFDENLSMKQQRAHLHADAQYCRGDKWFGTELRIVCHLEVASLPRAGEDRQTELSQLHLTAQRCSQLIFNDRFEGVDVHKEWDGCHYQYDRSKNCRYGLPLMFHRYP